MNYLIITNFITAIAIITNYFIITNKFIIKAKLFAMLMTILKNKTYFNCINYPFMNFNLNITKYYFNFSFKLTNAMHAVKNFNLIFLKQLIIAIIISSYYIKNFNYYIKIKKYFNKILFPMMVG